MMRLCERCGGDSFFDGEDGFFYCGICSQCHKDAMIDIILEDNQNYEKSVGEAKLVSQCESSSQLSESLKNLDLNQNKVLRSYNIGMCNLR